MDTRILVNGDERQYPAGIAHFLEHKVFEDENGQDYLKNSFIWDRKAMPLQALQRQVIFSQQLQSH